MTIAITVAPGTTGLSVTVPVRATAFTGAGLDEVSSAQLTTWFYKRDNAAIVTDATSSLASATAAHSDGGFISVGADTYMHRFDVPDAALAAGAKVVTVWATDSFDYFMDPIVISLVEGGGTVSEFTGQALRDVRAR